MYQIESEHKKKTVSLVLGSGGARGLAHIGVIHWLIENDYIIRSISGTSIGALIGGIYAAGKLDTYTHWAKALEKIDVIGLLDLSFRGTGLLKGERIIRIMKDMIGDVNIEDLPIAFTAIATDIQHQKEVWINRGPMFDAIRASIAVPTVFTPHEYMGMQLLDGSLVNPVPIAPTLNDKTDLTIAVNLSGKARNQSDIKKQIVPVNGNGYKEKIKKFVSGLQPKQESGEVYDFTLYEIIAKSMDTMLTRITRLQLAAYTPDVLISIPVNAASIYEFYRANELIELGYQKTKQVFECM
ncbi:MAG: patatin-like phospholipase family protein [Thiohalomonadales bacterium]